MNFFKLLSKNGFNTNPWLPLEVQAQIEAYGVNRAYSVQVDLIDPDRNLVTRYYLTYNTQMNMFPLIPTSLYLNSSGKYYDVANVFHTEMAIIGEHKRPMFKGQNKVNIINEE